MILEMVIFLTNGIFEVANGSTSGFLELNDVDARIKSLGVADDLHGHLIILHQFLYFAQFCPKIVRIEDAKLPYTSELIDMLWWDL